MKKVIVGIFAHPDDEAFLAAGSFVKWVDEGAELHLICATRGENGENPDGVQDLGATRTKEWHDSGTLMGSSSQTQLGYPDGSLSNMMFHEIAEKVIAVIRAIAAKQTAPFSLQIVTYENCGVTGHLDHIAMSFITTYVYTQLRSEHTPHVHDSSLLYICACEAVAPNLDTTFVFMPKGNEHDEIDLTIDVVEYLERKKQVMRAHASQHKDCESIIARLGTNLRYEHFNQFKD